MLSVSFEFPIRQRTTFKSLRMEPTASQHSSFLSRHHPGLSIKGEASLISPQGGSGLPGLSLDDVLTSAWKTPPFLFDGLSRNSPCVTTGHPFPLSLIAKLELIFLNNRRIVRWCMHNLCLNEYNILSGRSVIKRGRKWALGKTSLILQDIIPRSPIWAASPGSIRVPAGNRRHTPING